MHNLLVRNLRHDRVMLFRKQKDMSGICRVDVKNAYAVIVLIDFLRLRPSCNNMAEYALFLLKLPELFRAHVFELFLQLFDLLGCHFGHKIKNRMRLYKYSLDEELILDLVRLFLSL